MGSIEIIPKAARTWWKDAVVYQIWPASFKDSNGDGLGDVNGIIDSLDHIQNLGADAIWVCPIYKSPQIDFGYDISNYEDIHKPFGTLQDVERLIASCHKRGMRILMDLVVNHTSDQHRWFQESRQSKDNPKRDWYIWKPARFVNGKRHPPNNWRSNFSGSAWTWDEETQEYYLHLFAREQPDLNWECRQLRDAVYQSSMIFWLDRGIDGFRIDTMAIFSKNPDFPNGIIRDPNSEWQSGRDHYAHQPEVFNILREMNAILSRYGSLMTVGEFGNLSDVEVAAKYVSAKENCVSMGFQFDTVCLGYSLNNWNIQPFSLGEFKATLGKWQQFIEGNDSWTCVFLENHDIARSVSRFGSDRPEYRELSAKMLAMLQATSTGTLFIYQGQEIGMTNISADWPIEEYLDISSQNYWKSVLQSCPTQETLESAMGNIRKVARDHARTPMQWTDDAHGGFTDCEAGPWMRVNDNYTEINVKQQNNDAASVLSFWKTLIKLRKQHIDLFVHGSWRNIDYANPSLFLYTKTFGNQKAFVALNFTPAPQSLAASSEFSKKHLALSNVSNVDNDVLSPYEARLYIS